MDSLTLVAVLAGVGAAWDVCRRIAAASRFNATALEQLRTLQDKLQHDHEQLEGVKQRLALQSGAGAGAMRRGPVSVR